jgi:hypothetical protein
MEGLQPKIEIYTDQAVKFVGVHARRLGEGSALPRPACWERVGMKGRFFDQGVNLSGHKVDAGQQSDCAVALVNGSVINPQDVSGARP